MRVFIAVSCGIGLLACGNLARAQAGDAAAAVGELRLARYTTQTIAPEPQAAHPLSVVASVNFPRGQVRTVGDALVHLLARTGYALVPPTQLDDAARALLDLPLPESHRRLGPYRVDTMLQVLLGDAWTVEIDALSRSVRFEADGCVAVNEATTGETAAREVSAGASRLPDSGTSRP